MKVSCVLLALLAVKAMSQTIDSTETLRVEPFGSARSKLIAAGPGEIISIRPERRGELVPAIFIYRESVGPVAKNDEEGDESVFRWTVAEQALYQVVIYSRGEVEVTYKIQRLPPEPTRGESRAGNPDAQIVPVYVATNRKQVNIVPARFSAEPNDNGALSYAALEVKIPIDHRMGQIEYPTVLRYLFGVDSEKYFVTSELKVIGQERFLDEIRRLSSRSAEGDALVFVHGFNTTMEEGVRRTAQLAYDLKFKGPAIMFSWPSHDSLLDYNKDGRNAELSGGPLRDLLLSLSQRAGVKRIHVIAHSMGNRVLAQALTRIGDAKSTIREIALMAPDIDAELFRELASRFPKSVGPIALYASSRDKALLASASFGGYRRAGQGGRDILVVPGIDTIDASSVDTSLIGIGHQYYADRREILTDLYSFFRGDPPQSRISIHRAASGEYWIFAP